MAGRLDDLAAIETAVWDELQRCIGQRQHPWRSATLATVDGDAADARVVVLREVQRDARQLLVYSDARAAKLAQLRAHPIGTIVCWSQALGWQLRLRVRLSADTEGLSVSSRWTRLKLTPAAQDYLSALPPGSALAAAQTTARASRSHFAVLTAEVLSLDWLELHAEGHRRARFADGRGVWLQA